MEGSVLAQTFNGPDPASVYFTKGRFAGKLWFIVYQNRACAAVPL
jgi:hypothetical protein